MKRPPQDPDEGVKDPTTPPCADPPVWPPAEDAEVTLFTIPGKPMPWASVIDVRSASRLQIAGFDPPLFEPRTPAAPLTSAIVETASIEEPHLSAIDEGATELALNAEVPEGAPGVVDLELLDDEAEAFDEPTGVYTPFVWPEIRDAPEGWSPFATFHAAALRNVVAGRARARAWIAARPRPAVRQFVATSIASGRETASHALSRANRRAGMWSRAILARRLALMAVVSRVVTRARSSVLDEWPRAMGRTRAVVSRAVTRGRTRLAAPWPRVHAAWKRKTVQWSHGAAALQPRLVAAIEACNAIAIRAWASARSHTAMVPSATAELAVQHRRHLRMAAIATASFLLALGAALLVWSIAPLAPSTRSIAVDGTLAAKPVGAVAALAPAIGQRTAAIVSEVRSEVTRPSLARVEPPRATPPLVPRRADAVATTISLPPPVPRDAVRADLSSAPPERPRDALVPAPFPTPREDALRASRTDEARIDLSPPRAERSGDGPVPAPFPTPRADPPRADPVAVPGEAAASEGINQALRQLEVAYRRRDATLAKTVWPTVNERALARAFDGLRSQSVTFDRCELDVSGAAGDVQCRGVTVYVPLVGSQDRRSESRQWKFHMEKGVDRWLIVSAAAR